MYKLTALAAALACAPCTPLFAADDATLLDTVVVTATRTETSSEDLPVPVVIIDRATIERSPGASLPDLLRREAGLEVAQNGGPGQLASLFIRGTESDHVLVLIDGVEINPGSIGTPQLQNIDPAMIERVEIVKGPRSSLYGSEAIGGVINIITRRATGQSFNAAVGAGSFGSAEAGFGYGYGNENTHLRLDVNQRTSDGYAPRRGADIERGYDNLSVNLRVNHRIGDYRIGLQHYESEGETEYLGGGVFGSPYTPLSQDFSNHVTTLRGDYAGKIWHGALDISLAGDELRQNDSMDFDETSRRTVEWQNDFMLSEDNTFTAGFQQVHEEVNSDSFGAFDETTIINALYLQDHLQFEDFHLLLAARQTDHETYGNQTSWNVDAGFDATEKLTLRANVARAFRSPNAAFLYNPNYGNPDLQPEIALNRELGVDWRPVPNHELSLALFRNDVDDLIGSDPVTFALINIDEARIEGIELAYDWQSTHWQLEVHANWQDPRDVRTDTQLLRRARHNLGASLVHHLENIDVSLDLLASGPRRDIDASTFAPVENPGYATGNLSVTWRMTQRWSLAGRVENLADREYETVSGYLAPGRSIFVSLRYQ